ncbi:2OG-Fe(II) oxygenase [Crocinitomix catalasitica]|uniref:2OG-Fe(II) oxygenase n=1 Tax=Crocinitomix catalasitica TaxID=184607 RepID=UPI0004824C96|nr:2OG-Fe(II) oxygenase [Crocinitomix catalasitica]
MNYFKEEQYIAWMDAIAEEDFVVIDNFIDDDMFQEISTFFEEKLVANDLEKAGIGAMGLHVVEKKIRGDYVYWLEENELSAYFSMIQEMMDQIRRLCFVSLSDFECHLAHYPAGTFYKKHVDQFKERNNRIISFVLYLNEDWKKGDGGELIIHKEKGKIVVEPIKNRLILFKSADVLHEVAMTNEKRLSITGWMLNNPVGLGFLAK